MSLLTNLLLTFALQAQAASICHNFDEEKIRQSAGSAGADIQILPAVAATQNHIDRQAGGIERALSLLERRQIDPASVFKASDDTFKIEAGRLVGDYEVEIFPALPLSDEDDTYYIPPFVFNIVGLHIRARLHKDDYRGLEISQASFKTNDGSSPYSLDLMNLQEVRMLEDFQEVDVAEKPYLLRKSDETDWRSLSFLFFERPVVFERERNSLYLEMASKYNEALLNILNGSRIDVCIYFLVADGTL